MNVIRAAVKAGSYALRVALHALCAILSWIHVHPNYCSHVNASPPTEVAYCNDAMGNPILDLSEAIKCCNGTNHDVTPSTPNPQCDLQEIGQTDGPGTVQAILSDLARAQQNVKNAAALISPGKPVIDLGSSDLSQTAAATAAAGAGIPGRGSSSLSGAGSGSGTPPLLDFGKNLLGGAGGVGSGFGGSSFLNDVNGSDSASGGGDGGDNGADGTEVADSESGSTYSHGGSGGAYSRGEGSERGDESGQGKPALSADAQGAEMDFGSGSDDVNPMGSADPAGYFDLIPKDESLFKVVERRYRKKTLQWVEEDQVIRFLPPAPKSR